MKNSSPTYLKHITRCPSDLASTKRKNTIKQRISNMKYSSDRKQQGSADERAIEPERSSSSVIPDTKVYEQACRKVARLEGRLVRLEEEWGKAVDEMYSTRSRLGICSDN